jgi:predicted DCC family thiol-disulfide oxidoreductase YuxK
VEAVQWVGADRRLAAGPDAIALLLRHGGRMWPMLGRLMQVSLVRAVAWPAYRWVARNRHRLPGGTAACAAPPPPRPAPPSPTRPTRTHVPAILEPCSPVYSDISDFL